MVPGALPFAVLTQGVHSKSLLRIARASIAFVPLALGCGSSAAPGNPDAGAPICTASGDCEESQPVVAFDHVDTPIDYPDPPPTSGTHAPCWVAYGSYATEIPDERWVHNLEHGAVVYLYDCPTGCADDVAALEALIAGKPFAVLAPYSLLPEPGFAVVAWGHRLVTDAVDADAFEAFYAAHVDQARESTSADPPASCPAP
jgi:hypothetical protein